MTRSETYHEHSAYSSPYVAEYYDLTNNSIAASSDRTVYWNAYQTMRDLRPHDGVPYVILDVGTGSGRVIRDLAAQILEANLPRLEGKFIGLDIEQHMLNRATKKPIKGLDPGQISWILGSALELSEIFPSSNGGTGQFDMVIFPYGNISHLIEPGEPECFLHQLAKVVKPGTGRAYISIVHMLAAKDENPAWLVEMDAPNEIPSQDFPNVTYRWETKDIYLEGNLRKFVCLMSVSQKQPGLPNRILETRTVYESFRTWGVGEFEGMVAQSSLYIVEKITGKHEDIYCLALN